MIIPVDKYLLKFNDSETKSVNVALPSKHLSVQSQ